MQWSEIQIANKNATLIRNTTPINVRKEYEPNIEKEDAKNVEEKNEGEEEFEQKPTKLVHLPQQKKHHMQNEK